MKLFIRLVPLCLVLLIAAPAFCQQDSVPLGDVARQNKPTKKAARVITNDDMPEHSSSDEVAPSTNSGADTVTAVSANASGTASSNNAPQSKASQPPATGGKQDSPAIANLKAQLADVKSEQAAIESRIKQVEANLAAEQDPARQEEFAEMLKRINNSLDIRKSRSADLQNKIDQLQSGKSSQ